MHRNRRLPNHRFLQAIVDCEARKARRDDPMLSPARLRLLADCEAPGLTEPSLYQSCSQSRRRGSKVKLLQHHELGQISTNASLRIQHRVNQWRATFPLGIQQYTLRRLALQCSHRSRRRRIWSYTYCADAPSRIVITWGGQSASSILLQPLWTPCLTFTSVCWGDRMINTFWEGSRRHFWPSIQQNAVEKTNFADTGHQATERPRVSGSLSHFPHRPCMSFVLRVTYRIPTNIIVLMSLKWVQLWVFAFHSHLFRQDFCHHTPSYHRRCHRLLGVFRCILLISLTKITEWSSLISRFVVVVDLPVTGLFLANVVIE